MDTNNLTQPLINPPEKAQNQLEKSNIENVANNTQLLSPAFVQPFPKAAPRTEGKRGRKKGKSRVVTDSLEKNELKRDFWNDKTD